MGPAGATIRAVSRPHVFAPGRVNLIGEHVDYAGGLVLPCAIELGIRIPFTPTGDGIVHLTSATQPRAARVALDGSGLAPEGWSRYVAAVVEELRLAGVRLVAIAGEVESDLPAGSGLSSSAALEVAVVLALLSAAGETWEPMAVARLAQRAEHRAVGVPCGIMDQAASVLGRAGHAVLLDCRTLEHRAVRIPDDLALLVIHSGIPRRLEESRYALRRAEVEVALAAAPDAVEGLPEAPRRRLRHVVSEIERVRAVVAELERPDGPDRAALGALLLAGHVSMRDDFEASHPAIDRLVEIAYDEGAVAARITGGGFGGAIVALADAGSASELAARVADRYSAETRHEATWLATRPADGARVVARP